MIQYCLIGFGSGANDTLCNLASVHIKFLSVSGQFTGMNLEFR